MKKILAIFFAAVLVLAGLFFWKGGHHALYLADQLEDWLDRDDGDQFVTVQLSAPTFSVDESGGTIEPEVRQLSFSADTFWTEYADRRICGLKAGGATAWLADGSMFLESGAAYSLPDLPQFDEELRELMTGFLLSGRITKSNGSYHLTMEREELSIRASVTVDGGISAMSLNVGFPYEGTPVQLLTTMTTKRWSPHPVPQTVSDAMVRAKMERPMPITEPLQILIPAMEGLIPLQAHVKLQVDCGILTVSDTISVSLSDGQAKLTRKDQTTELPLPEGLQTVDPLAGAIALLASGELTTEDGYAQLRISLPPETTAELMAQLVPQAADLGLTIEQSEALLQIREQRLSSVTMTASGSVPFLITTIPLSFSAEFQIQ